VTMRYRITPATPARASLPGEDIKRCIEYLKSLKVEYKALAEARNDFGNVTKAQFNVAGSLPCQLLVRGDYEAPAPGVIIELLNVRRPGKVECRLSVEQLEQASDDLARYLLGVDDEFDRLLKKK